MSTATALSLAAAGVAPASGGAISQFAGINVTYGIAVGICLIALIPILSVSETRQRLRPNLRKFKWRRYSRDFLAGGCMSVDDFVQENVWPIVIYLLIPTYAAVGGISSVMVISAILISLYIGRREAVRGEKHYINRGTYLLTAVGALRFVVGNSLHVTGLNFLYGASRAMVDTPWLSRYFEKARASQPLEYVFLMQVFSCLFFALAGFFVCLVLAFLPSLSGLLLALLLLAPFVFGIKLIR